jgi:hypothetical protein
MDFRAELGLADDEMAISKIVPTDLLLLNQAMILRKHDENPLRPKAGCLAAIGGRLAGQKGDIHPVMLNR